MLDEGSSKILGNVTKLKEQNKQLEEELKQVETEYLAKMSKLMIMAHVVIYNIYFSTASLRLM